MTLGLAGKVQGQCCLAADSRFTSDSYLYPPSPKIQKLGALYVITSGPVAQSQRVFRSQSYPTNVQDLITLLEGLRVTNVDWLVSDGRHVYSLIHWEESGDSSYDCQRARPGQILTTGDGGSYAEGYIDAAGRPTTPTSMLGLFKDTLHACAKRYTSVGPPFKTKVIPCPSQITRTAKTKSG